jgi:transporter family protein
MWVSLTLASALLLAGYDVAKKHCVNRNAVMPVLFLAALTGAVFFTGLLLATGRLSDALTVSGLNQARIALKGGIVAGSWICLYYAMRALPISIVAPIRSSAPLWTLIGAILLFHEVPSFAQAVGMGLVLAGYVLFSRASRKEGIHFGRHRGILLVALGTLLGAAAALYDKFLLQRCHIPPNALQFWFSLWLVLLIGGALALQRGAGWSRTPFVWRSAIPVVGILLSLADWFYFHALAEPGVAISIVSLIRRSSVAVSFTLGALLFREGNLRSKGFALAAILAGVAILCLAK